VNPISQEQLLNDIKTQIYQYVYRSTEMPWDTIVQFIQDISGAGNMNWHSSENKLHLTNVFTNITVAINEYTLEKGDFRAYLHQSMVNILTEEYLQPLFAMYLQRGYNVAPETVIGSITDAFTTAPPQNSNFPGVTNTSGDFIPEAPTTRLVPKSLYTTPLD
jgi:hypothetical protein